MEAGGDIPKIIHQIWIGNAPRPNEWIDTVKDFATKYGYKYMLWNERNIKELGLKDIPALHDIYKGFAHELAGRADIIRLLALYKYGGVYIDADSVIMKPEKFCDFLEKNKAPVFFGWENLTAARTRKLKMADKDINRHRRLIANGVIGSQKEHPFFKKLLKGIEENVNDLNEEERTAAWKVMGPYYVTRMYYKSRKEFPDVHIYPMKYFYPRHWHGITDPELHKKIKIPGKSMLFQYGYSTNSFNKIFEKRKHKRGATRKGRKD